jgi:exodeoxyribonuclease VII large subunit
MLAAPASNIVEYTVAELAFALKRTVENAYGLVRVRGEISSFKRAGSGHLYFCLKDEQAVLDAVCWRTSVGRIPFQPEDGLEVICTGKLTTYPGRSRYQLVVERMEPAGAGALMALLEERKRRLAAEGLFDAARKRPVPFLPGCIGLITGRASAAEHDVVSNATTRWPAVCFRLEHTATQGVLAVPQIVDALEALDRDPQVDVIVLARGGGSVEDLLPFSDETLCRAVAACRTPVVSAIGHEPDTPLVDYVADVRCSTPTEAGRRLVPDVAEETARVAGLRDRARRALAGWVDREERLLAALRHRPVLADPFLQLDALHAEVERLRASARACAARGLDARETEVAHLAAQLTALGPAATLARGYAVVQRLPEGQVPGAPLPVLRATDEAPPGTRLRIRVADGAVAAVVETDQP